MIETNNSVNRINAVEHKQPLMNHLQPSNHQNSTSTKRDKATDDTFQMLLNINMHLQNIENKLDIIAERIR